MLGKNINFVSDAVDWLIKNYEGHPAFEKLREYMKLCNTHSFFVPESPVYRAATTQWKGLDEKIFCGIVTSKNEVPEKPFAAHIDLSQFNIIEVNGKLMSVPSQQERDLTYK